MKHADDRPGTQKTTCGAARELKEPIKKKIQPKRKGRKKK